MAAFSKYSGRYKDIYMFNLVNTNEANIYCFRFCFTQMITNIACHNYFKMFKMCHIQIFSEEHLFTVLNFTKKQQQI